MSIKMDLLRIFTQEELTETRTTRPMVVPYVNKTLSISARMR